ncbi:MAG TPA: phosphoribosylaminoimidazolesuccinocarboxamide synthase [Bacillota bacterium]|nr:phosphoribosylaminoimidazolesuccinocarboxamide synthase [Bacillota bacterium]
MEKLDLLYEGKAKQVYNTTDPDVLWIYYKDSATAFNAQKKAEISGKGELNNLISAHFFGYLRENGVDSHFVKLINPREMLVKRLDIIKVEVTVRNVAAGSMTRRLGVPEGTALSFPILEYSFKDDTLGDPLINTDHALAMGLASREELHRIREISHLVNDILRTYLKGLDIILVDFKLEFGRYQGQIMLGDEISPDTCRFWDSNTGNKLDKDRFRLDLGGLAEAYGEIWNRLTSVSVQLSK